MPDDTIPGPDSKTHARLAPRLDYLPVSLFGGIMGLAGLSIGWHVAAKVLNTPEMISTGIGFVAIGAFVALSIAYLIKLVTAPDKVTAEFNNLIAGNLFGTISISLLLLPILVVHYSLPVARVLWLMGAGSMILFAWTIVVRWISRPHEAIHVTPTWIVPAVGLLDVPLALPLLDMPQLDGLMLFSLAVGLVFAVPVFTLNLNRLIVGPPLPDALLPTLLMLAAPFAVGVSSYVVTAGKDDMFADALYMLTLFMMAVLVWRLARTLPGKAFKLSWWGTSFPLAATAIAALRYAGYHPGPIAVGIAVVLLALATLAITALMVRTLIGLVRGEFRALSS